MPYEVENKFPVSDPATIERRLGELGARLGEPEPQVDRYFNHPARDFAATDEALRIRSVADRNWLTYKGPKLDAATKTRREIELAFASGEAGKQQLEELLTALGFRPVAAVRKRRRGGTLRWLDREIVCTLDEVEGLGRFVELETLAEPADLDAARQAVLSLAARLELGPPQRKSYLRMLLERLPPGEAPAGG
jgi:adenylate cyclase class 2